MRAMLSVVTSWKLMLSGPVSVQPRGLDLALRAAV
jgi:hypothetical protein